MDSVASLTVFVSEAFRAVTRNRSERPSCAGASGSTGSRM